MESVSQTSLVVGLQLQCLSAYCDEHLRDSHSQPLSGFCTLWPWHLMVCWNLSLRESQLRHLASFLYTLLFSGILTSQVLMRWLPKFQFLTYNTLEGLVKILCPPKIVLGQHIHVNMSFIRIFCLFVSDLFPKSHGLINLIISFVPLKRRYLCGIF